MAEVVAEGPFLPHVTGGDGPFQDELRRRRDPVPGRGPNDHIQRPTHHQRRQQAFVDPFRQGDDGGQRQRKKPVRPQLD